MSRYRFAILLPALVASVGLLSTPDAAARGQFVRGANTSVNRNFDNRGVENRGVESRGVENRNIDDRNINVNRNVNVNVDDHGCCDHHDNWYYDHPVATAAAVTTTVAVTAAAIGSIVHSVPPSCASVVVNGIAYQQCGSTWYQPQYSGSSVQYVVVVAPR